MFWAEGPWLLEDEDDILMLVFLDGGREMGPGGSSLVRPLERVESRDIAVFMAFVRDFSSSFSGQY